MYEQRFSKWITWSDRENLRNLDQPGVYVIAYATKPLNGNSFSWIREIIYIGMTNAGLLYRLRQFDVELNGRPAHGGADRVRFRYRN